MSVDETLARVTADIERGDLGKARDRLHGLLRTYPESIEARRRLGEVYWQLQYPDRAGCYWYLIESDSPEMDQAKAAFEARWGNNAGLMLHAIGYHGPADKLRGAYARKTMQGLLDRARMSWGRKGKRSGSDERTFRSRLDEWGCIAALGLAAVFLVVTIGVGVVTIGAWILRLIAGH